jgi:hypothetical protein
MCRISDKNGAVKQLELFSHYMYDTVQYAFFTKCIVQNSPKDV